jgi:plasmid stabilization system protein ParE
MKIVFDAAASGDLDRTYAWIARDNPRAAIDIIERIEAKVMRLATQGSNTWNAAAKSKARASFQKRRTSSFIGLTKTATRLSSSPCSTPLATVNTP